MTARAPGIGDGSIGPRVGVGRVHLLRDPDGNGIELYYDRPREQWPRAADGSLQMFTRRLDLRALAEA